MNVRIIFICFVYTSSTHKRRVKLTDIHMRFSIDFNLLTLY